jgi:ornithine carbamoyltransferase
MSAMSTDTTSPDTTSPDLHGRHFLKEIDFTGDELRALLALSASLKTAKHDRVEVPRLGGRNIALVFEKTSTRTRCAFEVAAHDQGAHVTYLDPAGSHLGHKESIADTARVLGRMFDAIQFRGTRQTDVEALAEHAGVPVYNGLTDEWHPTQMLADMLTMHEHGGGRDYADLSYAFLGDCRFNMARSLLVTGALLGADVRLVGPEALQPDLDVVRLARDLASGSGASITVTADVDAGLRDVDFVHTDVWVSMGEPKEVWTERVDLLRPYRVDRDALARADNPDVRFMHCLPAFHDAHTVVGREMMEHVGLGDGIEVTDDVFESPASIVFDQAENRLHTIKAIMVATIGS